MQALAFDFDGLILDTESPELLVWTEEFQAHGVEMPADYWTQVIGRGAEQKIERPPQLLARLASSYKDSPEADRLRRAKIMSLIELEGPRPGIERLVAECVDSGMAIGIASSSRHEWVERFLDRLGLREAFSTIVCADDVARAKPFPDLYLELCRQLSAEPFQTVALEDSPNGLAAARAAGVFAVAVPNSVTVRLDLSAADMRIDRLEDWNLSRIKEAFDRERRG